MENRTEILIIDDEPQIRKLLRINLESNEYRVSLAETAKEGITLAAVHPPDIILLDLSLPDKDGQLVLRELREWYNNPIIVLSVRDNESDIVTALDHGATDYLSKPFRTGELLARIRSALRRSGSETNELCLETGDLTIDLGARVVKKGENVLKLTTTEYNLLILLAKNEGKVLTHQFLLKEIWGIAYQNETQYLRVFVGTLRKKIEDNPNLPVRIITESGIGYRFQ